MDRRDNIVSPPHSPHLVVLGVKLLVQVLRHQTSFRACQEDKFIDGDCDLEDYSHQCAETMISRADLSSPSWTKPAGGPRATTSCSSASSKDPQAQQ
ncbi:hypothetical protein D9619_008899 [Psilocybe cf. subviscida]|uniref:Uncharacterized protein n=1 Tax=Psilocybe cf. subviscida TaxID=2480587 RepID=A0A8H5BAL4_9AGAR|nr:hypothetical protein D9619_008899 [Psilocybe cf. subviscida]